MVQPKSTFTKLTELIPVRIPFRQPFWIYKLKYLDAHNTERRKSATLYTNKLRQIDAIKLQEMPVDSESVYHLFNIRVKQRDKLQRFLAENGVGSLIHYPIPPHMQNAYKHLYFKMEIFLLQKRLKKKH
jgi:dTDP-4-amino-4,6-dideoxygalactose transaminase